MSWLRDLLGVYRRVLQRSVELTVRHWWLALVAFAYTAALLGVLMLVAPLGLVGGFIGTLVMAALMSSWLVLLGHVVRSGRAVFSDIRDSFFVYLGDVVTFGFLLWALQFIGSVAFAHLGYAAIVFDLAVLVFLSAFLEEIYLGGHSGVTVFVESYRFVSANWIEWLPATGILLLLVFAAGAFPFGPVAFLLSGLALTFMFIGRGLLFLELSTSSRRAREFQRRAAR